MKNLLSKSALLLLFSFVFIACTKEKNPETAGEQATTLNQGNGVMETIQRNPNGSTVVFSNWITKTQNDWSGLGSGVVTTDINTTSLTEAVKNQGIVLVYFDYFGIVYPLPFLRLEYNQVIDFSFITGKITLYLKVFDSSITSIANLNFRYILIPNTAFGNTGNGRMTPPVDYNDYNAVCEYYGIPK